MIDWLTRDPRQEPLVDVDGRGLPVVVRRHATARRMTLRLGPDGSDVRVTIPRWGRTQDALAFAQSRADWLARQLAALPASEPVRPGAALRWRGETLTIVHEAAAPRMPARDGEAVRLGGPESSVEARLRRWLEGEALAEMARDLGHYCALVGKPPPRLALSRAKRRWGSCAPDGSIRINWRLIMAPDFVRRSVVAHEVAHLVHFDHSPRFHALLDELFEGDIGAANRWLKREGRGLYLPFG